jgi:hypothetical protein
LLPNAVLDKGVVSNAESPGRRDGQACFTNTNAESPSRRVARTVKVVSRIVAPDRRDAALAGLFHNANGISRGRRFPAPGRLGAALVGSFRLQYATRGAWSDGRPNAETPDGGIDQPASRFPTPGRRDTDDPSVIERAHETPYFPRAWFITAAATPDSSARFTSCSFDKSVVSAGLSTTPSRRLQGSVSVTP